MICGHLANRIYNDWSEFIIFHGGGTEKSDGDDQIHGTDFKVINVTKYTYHLVRAIITIDISTHHNSIPKKFKNK